MNATSLHWVSRIHCMAHRLWYGHYDSMPLRPPLSKTNLQTQTRSQGEGGVKEEHNLLFTHSLWEAWHGNLFLMLMQRDTELKNLPSSSWDGSMVRQRNEMEHRDTLAAYSVTWCHQAQPQPRPEHPHKHQCVWFIHHEASIIQTQIVVLKHPQSIYIKISSTLWAKHESYCRKILNIQSCFLSKHCPRWLVWRCDNVQIYLIYKTGHNQGQHCQRQSRIRNYFI